MTQRQKKHNKVDDIRTAKLFRNGRNQAVRLPKEFEMNVREVIIHRHGTSLILTPKHDTWEDYFASAQTLSDDFPDEMSELHFEAREEL
ncbi:MAG: antitoxin [Desulfovermiculus sp.]|nr:antitoxin [Desulfovermiculus sp.]